MINFYTPQLNFSYQNRIEKKSIQNTGLSSPKSDMIHNKLPNISFKGNYMFELDNQEKNKIWTKKFDEAFDNNDVEDFLNFINHRSKLRPIFNSSPNNLSKILINPLFNAENDEEDAEIKMIATSTDTAFPVKTISIKNDEISLSADKTGNIQISNTSMGNLFVERSAFDNETNMKEVDKEIIANGARGFDPFDQEDWPKVIGRKWPTAENTRDPNGVAHLSLDDDQKAIFLDTDNSITESYGTKPRAMAILDKENNSVILAFQQENLNPNIDFAAWSILPFKIREGKKTMAIFPADKKTLKNYESDKNKELKEIKKSSQWNIDENKFFVVDVSHPSQKTEYTDPYADWCLFATQGEDTACLVRSCYKDNTENKQFKVFSGQQDLGGTKYFELEFIAPKVKKGQKSTLVYRIEFISLKKMGFDSLNDENMDSQIKEIGKTIENKINFSKAIANMTFANA